MRNAVKAHQIGMGEGKALCLFLHLTQEKMTQNQTSNSAKILLSFLFELLVQMDQVGEQSSSPEDLILPWFSIHYVGIKSSLRDIM